ncbi:MAG: glycoside hydrolase family 57 protein [Bacteroidales bacterium]|nr:glycoside hydrolase family 57 protein [Bacteroidales bacterium]MDD4384739.1 glycoside hydrolase family 57 protein [Bacteroidales bacterium]MDY0196542.1 glycoside hydrolase family 57 protein [Tenuifilaceae bacterium]
MKTICFYFQVHQPFRLRRYRFFDIGKSHNYFDEFSNRSIMRKVAEKCYLPTNNLMLGLINEFGNRFKISYSISGTALDQFELYAPDVLESFKRLAETGCVEFLAETYSHSLSALKCPEEFEMQVHAHSAKIEQLFGQKPTTFRNTELIYSDEIGAMVADLGYKAMLTEGAKHIMGWKSSNYLYTNAINPKLRLLLKNFQLSDDIAFRFSNRGWEEWPLSTEKYVDWLNSIDSKDEIINLFMDYETFGEHQWAETGIFEFLKALPKRVFSNSNFEFLTPAEAAKKHQPIAPLHVPYPISWADEERDLTAWLGNELQDDAFNNLYSLIDKVKTINDPNIQRDWRYLQTSDHFYYMCTKWFSDGDVHKYFNPYDSPYDAFITYMNAFSDFKLRVDAHESIASKSETLIPEEVDVMIEEYEKKIKELKLLREKAKPEKSVKQKLTSKVEEKPKAKPKAKPKSTKPAPTKASSKAKGKSKV